MTSLNDVAADEAPDAGLGIMTRYVVATQGYPELTHASSALVLLKGGAMCKHSRIPNQLCGLVILPAQ